MSNVDSELLGVLAGHLLERIKQLPEGVRNEIDYAMNIGHDIDCVYRIQHNALTAMVMGEVIIDDVLHEAEARVIADTIADLLNSIIKGDMKRAKRIDRAIRNGELVLHVRFYSDAPAKVMVELIQGEHSHILAYRAPQYVH